MKKFHITDEGEAKQCHASKGKCPFGGSAQHFSTVEAARKSYEISMAGEAEANMRWEKTLEVNKLRERETQTTHKLYTKLQNMVELPSNPDEGLDMIENLEKNIQELRKFNPGAFNRALRHDDTAVSENPEIEDLFRNWSDLSEKGHLAGSQLNNVFLESQLNFQRAVANYWKKMSS